MQLQLGWTMEHLGRLGFYREDCEVSLHLGKWNGIERVIILIAYITGMLFE